MKHLKLTVVGLVALTAAAPVARAVACQVFRGAVVRRVPQSAAADLAAISRHPAPREMLPGISRHAAPQEMPPVISQHAVPREMGMSRQAPPEMPPGMLRHA